MTVAPVVVKPLIASKKASTGESRAPKKKGSAPQPAAASQTKVTASNASRRERVGRAKRLDHAKTNDPAPSASEAET